MDIKNIRPKNLISNCIIALVLIFVISAFLSPTVNQFFIMIAVAFAFLLYREITRTVEPTAPSSAMQSGDSTATPQQPANIPVAEAAGRAFKKLGQTDLKFGTAGAAIGFGIGYLTRPSFLGLKLDLAALYDSAYAPSEAIQSDFRMHMLVATAIGFFAAFILKKMMASKK